jgi:hypothetical protein
MRLNQCSSRARARRVWDVTRVSDAPGLAHDARTTSLKDGRPQALATNASWRGRRVAVKPSTFKPGQAKSRRLHCTHKIWFQTRNQCPKCPEISVAIRELPAVLHRVYLYRRQIVTTIQRIKVIKYHTSSITSATQMPACFILHKAGLYAARPSYDEMASWPLCCKLC